MGINLNTGGSGGGGGGQANPNAGPTTATPGQNYQQGFTPADGSYGGPSSTYGDSNFDLGPAFGLGYYNGGPGYGVNQNAKNIPGGADLGQMYSNMVGVYNYRDAPTMDQRNSNQWRQQQQSLAQALTAQANGQGPSLAQMQLQRATDQNMSNAMALGQSLRGPSAGGQLRGIQNQQSGLSQQAAADSGMLRMQEQMAARNQLGQLLDQGRGQDIGIANSNLGAYLNNQSQNDAMVKHFTSLGYDLATAQQQANMAMEQMNLGQSNYDQTAAANAFNSQQQRTQQAWSTGLNAASGSGSAITSLAGMAGGKNSGDATPTTATGGGGGVKSIAAAAAAG